MITNNKTYAVEKPEFPVPLPESVLKKYPDLELWQAENSIAWQRWWDILNSPVFNAKAVAHSQGAFRERIKPIPPFPAPLPARMLKKFPDLMQWQEDNSKRWEEICLQLGLYRAGEMEYGQHTTNASMESLETVYGIHYKPQSQLGKPRDYRNYGNRARQ
jgi:hypothetical protein